jgi:hypothetical protein
MDDDECGAVGGMIGRGKRSTRRKPAPVLLSPPQIPNDMIWTGTKAVPVQCQQLTARAKERPRVHIPYVSSELHELTIHHSRFDRLCVLVVRVLGYRTRGPG